MMRLLSARNTMLHLNWIIMHYSYIWDHFEKYTGALHFQTRADVSPPYKSCTVHCRLLTRRVCCSYRWDQTLLHCYGIIALDFQMAPYPGRPCWFRSPPSWSVSPKLKASTFAIIIAIFIGQPLCTLNGYRNWKHWTLFSEQPQAKETIK